MGFETRCKYIPVSLSGDVLSPDSLETLYQPEASACRKIQDGVKERLKKQMFLEIKSISGMNYKEQVPCEQCKK